MTAKIADQSNWQPREWIVPPGLEQVLQKFDTRTELIIEKFLQNNNQPLMINGPTGVGKSMFTEYFIHKFRKTTDKKTLIYLNCAAIPSELLESELFGFEKGGHSTATYSKPGYLEMAHDGIIVFEEVGEMARPLQAKLLMAIETRIFSRLGSTDQIEFKAQIIATTNAKQDSFREDFWFRFDIFTVPPIHERRCDILYYMERFDPALMRYLTKGVVLSALAYNWPGNVREIERVCFSIRENILNIKKNTLIEDEYVERVVSEHSVNRLSAIMDIDSRVSGFRFDKSQLFANALLKEDINAHAIDDYLQENKLSFDCFNPSFLSDLKEDNSRASSALLPNTSGYFQRLVNGDYMDTFFGLLQFCKFFFQKINSNFDILDLKSTVKYEEVTNNNASAVFTCRKKYIQRRDYKRNDTKKKGFQDPDPFKFFDKSFFNEPYYMNYVEHNKSLLGTAAEPREVARNETWKVAILESLKFLTKLKYIDENDINDLYGFYKKNLPNSFLSYYFDSQSQVENIEEIPIEEIAYSEIKELYYETLVNKIGFKHGSQKRIAEIAKFSTGTISQDFAELKIKEKFSSPNFPPRKRLVFLK